MRKAFMAATILVLLMLVLVTPRLIGVQEDISSLPRLILNYEEDQLVVFVTSLSGTYLYRALFLNITPMGEANATERHVENAHALEERVPLNETQAFVLETEAVDRRDSRFNLTLDVNAQEMEGDWGFSLLFSGESQPRTVSGEDLSNSPLVTLLERRELT